MRDFLGRNLESSPYAVLFRYFQERTLNPITFFRIQRLFKPLIVVCAFALGGSSFAFGKTVTPQSADSLRGFGIGVVVGEPTGLSAKLWLDREKALDFGLAFSFDDYVLLYSDYLFHFPGALGRSSLFVTQLTPYVGIGGVIAFNNNRYSDKDRTFSERGRDSVGVGVRIPLGLEWIPARPPLGVFLELVPGISIIPRTSGFIEGGVGVRYYF